MNISRRKWLQGTGVMAGAMAGFSAPSQGAEVASGEVLFQKKLEVRYNVDVFIAGGGPAGIAAAVAARKQNAEVFLAEGHSCLGGMGTAALVPVFMQMGDGVHFLAEGVGREVVNRLKEERQLSHAHDIEALKRVYDTMLTEAGVRFTFYTQLSDVVAEAGKIQYVICSAPSGMFAVKAKIYIDATGNGDLAVWAGAAYEKGDAQGNLMPGTLCSQWSGIDWKTWREKRPKIVQPDGYRLAEAFADGVFTVKDEHLTGMHQLGENLGGGNIGHVFGVDGTDEKSLTEGLIWGRKSMKEYARYYTEYLPGFENAKLIATGSLLGIRETRRILGDYVLCLDDYQKRAVFPDEIGRYAYPIDIHPIQTGQESYEQHRKEFDEKFRYAKGESYGIPYRILTPRGLDNLLVAGRCVSMDTYVHGSLRVMPGCFITGQAAGIAASMAAEQGVSVHQISVPTLQQKLKAFGAYLPNA
ncbi:MAG: FAD-dependent oxidoreductase [Planctomycetia bacterium]|nr:FAD-dependent oxidoreductase [Planctomycetia bacterium]